jgi:hypothetical protein
MSPLSKRLILVFSLLLPTALFAGDFSYQESTQLTGGSLLHITKMAGIVSSQARHAGDPIISSVYLKGNQLANVSPDNIQIIDLDKETITQIDVQKKTYTVMTFDQMKQAIENARQQMKEQAAKQPQQPAAAVPADQQNVKMSFDVKVRKTGAQKDVSGLQSNEAILTMTMTATNQDTQQSGNLAITNDMWMVPAIPGYEQIRDFYVRFAAKMADATTGLGYDFSKMLSQNPGAGQALGDMAKEMQKLDGVPIEQVMRMGTTTNGQPLPAASEAPDAASGPPAPTAGQVAKAGMASAISSRLGGFGGFGHKKQKDTPPPDQNPDSAQTPTSAILMETRIVSSNFSTDPVDPSHFQVPAGYTQVQPTPPRATPPPTK